MFLNVLAVNPDLLKQCYFLKSLRCELIDISIPKPAIKVTIEVPP